MPLRFPTTFDIVTVARWMLGISLSLVVVALGATAQAAAETPYPRIATHDNLQPAGRLQDGVLSLSLWAGVGRWYPKGEASEPRAVAAFGEEGEPLSIPSPLVRVPEGTLVQLAVRNTLASSLRIHGLCARPGTCEPLTIPANEKRELGFKLHAPGTFHYWATTGDRELEQRIGDDSQLGGAIVVDAAGADRRDRIFVMGLKKERAGERAWDHTFINGRSWPYTERLNYTVGDVVRWRVVNLTASAHAMHLHGFYFHVESSGDGVQDTRYASADRRLAVTLHMLQGRAAMLEWIPERAGNWLFHCHMLMHMVPSADEHTVDAAAAGMAGLVLGIHVSGGRRSATLPDSARRAMRLIIERDARHGDTPSYKVDLVATPPPPRVSDRAVPGPIMVLTRDEPVAVDIVNRLSEPTAIHWHGIELESYDDGVPGFGATDGRVTPPIAPGETFTARFTPSRAGTFIYHTHWHNAEQLSGGIYGPLIVLEPGQSYDPVTDHIVVIGTDGPYVDRPHEPFVINGETKPRPLDLKVGVAHRLRFINITPDNAGLTVQLLSRFDPARWTLVGKDGADVPLAQRAESAARQKVTVGETYDFELAPIASRSETRWMELRRANGELVFQWPVRVQ